MAFKTRIFNGRKHISMSEIERIHDFPPMAMHGLAAAVDSFRHEDGQHDTVIIAFNQMWLTDTAYYAMCSQYPESFPEHIMQTVLAALGHYDSKPAEIDDSCEHLPMNGRAPLDCELVVCQCVEEQL